MLFKCLNWIPKIYSWKKSYTKWKIYSKIINLQNKFISFSSLAVFADFHLLKLSIATNRKHRTMIYKWIIFQFTNNSFKYLQYLFYFIRKKINFMRNSSAPKITNRNNLIFIAINSSPSIPLQSIFCKKMYDGNGFPVVSKVNRIYL